MFWQKRKPHHRFIKVVFFCSPPLLLYIAASVRISGTHRFSSVLSAPIRGHIGPVLHRVRNDGVPHFLSLRVITGEGFCKRQACPKNKSGEKKGSSFYLKRQFGRSVGFKRCHKKSTGGNETLRLDLCLVPGQFRSWNSQQMILSR